MLVCAHRQTQSRVQRADDWGKWTYPWPRANDRADALMASHLAGSLGPAWGAFQEQRSFGTYGALILQVASLSWV